MSQELLLLGIMQGDEIVVPELYNAGTEGVSWVAGYSNGSGAQSKEAGYLALTGDVLYGERTYVTDVKVRLLRYNTLSIDWGKHNGTGDCYLCVSTSKTGSHSTYTLRITRGLEFGLTRSTQTLDISSLNSRYYIRVHARGNLAGVNLRAYKIWLE